MARYIYGTRVKKIKNKNKFKWMSYNDKAQCPEYKKISFSVLQSS